MVALQLFTVLILLAELSIHSAHSNLPQLAVTTPITTIDEDFLKRSTDVKNTGNL